MTIRLVSPHLAVAKLLGLLALAMALFAAGWTVNGWRLDRLATQQLLAAEQAERAQEQEWAQAQQEVQREAQRALDLAGLDRRRADLGHQRMLDAARAAAGGEAGSDPAASGGGQAAGPGCPVLADVLGEVDAAAGELAAALDVSRIAGQACQRAHDALSPQ